MLGKFAPEILFDIGMNCEIETSTAYASDEWHDNQSSLHVRLEDLWINPCHPTWKRFLLGPPTRCFTGMFELWKTFSQGRLHPRDLPTSVSMLRSE